MEEISTTEIGSSPVMGVLNSMVSPAFISCPSIFVMRGFGIRMVMSSVTVAVSLPEEALVQSLEMPVCLLMRALKKTTCSPFSLN